MAYVNSEAIVIPFLCSNASQRVVHGSFFSDSQVTRPALKMNTSQATIVVGPNAISTSSTWQSSGTSVGPGIYHLVLTQSECSAQGVPGYAILYTSNLTMGPQHQRLYFPRVDSYDTTRMGLVALPNAAAEAAGGLITHGTGTGQLHTSNGSVGLKAQTHSDVTIKGIENYRNISNVTLHAGTHSDVTIQGVIRLNSGVTLNANTHSGATIAGIVSGGIVSGSFAAGAIDAVALATDAGQEIADRLITRNIAGGSDTGRLVKDTFAVLRNRVEVDGSRLTVYGTDDSTSLWTADVTTGTNPISGIDPGGV